MDCADNESAYVGYDNDQSRSTANAPAQDVPGWDGVGVGGCDQFGSAHVTGCNYIFCDGSLQNLSYAIDPTVFKYLGGRNDTEIIDGKKF
jgi:hypothetical protein